MTDRAAQAAELMARHAKRGKRYLWTDAFAVCNYLALGRTVVADCVNPWPLTRAAWRSVAERTGVRALEVEVVCSDEVEHRRRVESRVADIDEHQLPTWKDVGGRDYRPWTTERLVIDTTPLSVADAVRIITDAL